MSLLSRFALYSCDLRSRCRIIAGLGATAVVPADRENKLEEWRHTLLVKIATFRNLQKIYMPGATAAITKAEEDCDNDAPPPKPEKVKLWMPSEMMPTSADDTLRGCVRGLVDMEAKIRVGQCENSLVSLRSRCTAVTGDTRPLPGHEA